MLCSLESNYFLFSELLNEHLTKNGGKISKCTVLENSNSNLSHTRN